MPTAPVCKLMNDQEDQDRLLAVLRGLAIKPSSDRAWSRAPAVRVIDCVLSLRRPYDRFVVQRLDLFERAHPGVRTISDLQQMMAAASSPHEFVLRELNYNHEERAIILDAVVRRLITISGTGPEQEQRSNLERWAKNSRPRDHRDLAIRGFALAGFQYLRMLFGANTIKPDSHICRFVESCIGRRVSPLRTLELLERMAPLAGLHLRDLDTTIWEDSARKERCTGTC